MKKIVPFLSLAALLLTACYHNEHDLPPKENPEEKTGYLTPLLKWEEKSDSTTTLDNLQFTVAGGSGTTVSQDFGSTQSAAEWLQQLPVGEYDLLVTTEMDETHGYHLETAVTKAATRADDDDAVNTLPDARVSLIDPSSSPAQAWFGVTHATVKEDQITVAAVNLQRLLAEVSVIVHGVPSGAAISVTVERVGRDVLLTQRDAQGRYGLVYSDDYLSVSLGSLTADAADAATLRHDNHTLMPTAGGLQRTYLEFTVTTPEGITLNYTADAPRMDCGKSYVVELDYIGLRPYMYLNAFTINDWTEGWTIAGEIFNPDE